MLKLIYTKAHCVCFFVLWVDSLALLICFDMWHGGAFTKTSLAGCKERPISESLGFWVALVEGPSLPGPVGFYIPDRQPLL